MVIINSFLIYLNVNVNQHYVLKFIHKELTYIEVKKNTCTTILIKNYSTQYMSEKRFQIGKMKKGFLFQKQNEHVMVWFMILFSSCQSFTRQLRGADMEWLDSESALDKGNRFVDGTSNMDSLSG